jgi:hypothetical protein
MVVQNNIFTPVYIYKIVERRTEVRYDQNGRAIRTMVEVIQQEYNPALIEALQQRIEELQDKLKTQESIANWDAQEWVAATAILAISGYGAYKLIMCLDS